MRTVLILYSFTFFLMAWACQSKKKVQQNPPHKTVDTSTPPTSSKTTLPNNSTSHPITMSNSQATVKEKTNKVKKRRTPKPLDHEIYAMDDTLIIRSDAVGLYNVLVNDYINYDKKFNQLSIIDPPKGSAKVKRVQGVDKIAYQAAFTVGDQDVFTYQICNEKGHCDTAQVLILHCPPRNIALAEVAEIVLSQGEKYTFTYADKMIRPDRSAHLLREQLTFSEDSSRLTFQSNADFIGLVKMNFNVYENWGICGLHRHLGVQNWIYVTPTAEQNQAPVAKTDQLSIRKNQKVTIKPLENDYDPEGMLKKKINRIWKPQKGTAKYSRTTITYTPDASFKSGKDTIRYQICDYNDKCVEGKVVITIE